MRQGRTAWGVAIAMALCACGAEETAPAAEPAARTTPPGPASPEEIELPSDLPRYPGAVASAGSDLGDRGVIVRLDTDHDTDRVLAFYREALEREGWSVEDEMSVSGQHMLRLSKGERQANVAITFRAGRTTISLSASPGS